VRVAGFLLLAWVVGRVSHGISDREAVRTVPAGFWTGVLHGAAMPCALPTLALGHDPIIYTPLNEGRVYKLGYTLGVNACGAVFFGVTYRRYMSAREKARAARA